MDTNSDGHSNFRSVNLLRNVMQGLRNMSDFKSFQGAFDHVLERLASELEADLERLQRQIDKGGN